MFALTLAGEFFSFMLNHHSRNTEIKSGKKSKSETAQQRFPVASIRNRLEIHTTTVAKEIAERK